MKTKYIKPFAECFSCKIGPLLEGSGKTLPFVPDDGTTEALAKEVELADEEETINSDISTVETKMHYRIEQEKGNWYDALDNWMGRE